MTHAIFDTAENIRSHVERLFSGDLCSPGMTFLFCDSDRRGIVATPIDDAPGHPTDEDCERVASYFAQAVSRMGGGVLLVLHRYAPAAVQRADLAWFRALREQCARHDVLFLGVWLATPSTVREITLDDLRSPEGRADAA